MQHPLDLDALNGRWHDILPIAAGIDRALLVNRHVQCPICEGKRSFRFDNKNETGSWICTHCGAGKALKLVMLRLRCDTKTALEEIARAAGTAPVTPAKQRRNDGDEERWRRGRAALWKGSGPVLPGSPGGLYLDYRCAAEGSYPVELRMGVYGRDGSDWPALVARVLSADGTRALQLQCVLLTADGRKAPVDEPKLTTPGAFPVGGAVRLAAAADEMGIAEGVETALSCAKMFGIPTWAALDAHHLELFEPPPCCTLLHVFGDRDGPPYFTGESASYAISRRLSHGRKVRVIVHLPDEERTDWNDVHQRRRA